MIRFLKDTDLHPFQNEDTPSGRVRALLMHQWQNFPMAKGFYDALGGVKEKRIDVEGLAVKVQFNPARIVSSAAKVDEKSIRERKCFLCENNLPAEQRALPFKDRYFILCNPFLIFPEHLTVPNQSHTDQRILGRITDMLDLSKELTDFVVFYNGPKCGASAPDHFHLQAGNKGFLPLETELGQIMENATIILDRDDLSVLRAKPFGANALLFLSENVQAIEKAFNETYHYLTKFCLENEEPMLNILSWMIDDRYCMVVYPRRLHRPTQFFAEGEANILLSPAAVDLAGVFITPLEKDFEKISSTDLQNIMMQISISDEDMSGLCDSLSK